jgi:hypothetical protein
LGGARLLVTLELGHDPVQLRLLAVQLRHGLLGLGA